MTKEKFIIITTINSINESIKKILKLKDYQLVVVGDKKTPPYKNDNLIFLDIKSQKKLQFESLKTCPYNSYQRKNIGYLYAVSNNAKIIAETDDDNYPLHNWGNVKFEENQVNVVLSPKIFNIYSEYTNKKIWPRGFPLDHILENERKKIINKKQVHVGIWQGLVNGDPDVDAIYRLTLGHKIKFSDSTSHILAKNVYCPFNSQNTFWEKPFFSYLYLPVTVSFRVTDILRGYVAQRCLWEHNAHLGFTGPTMFQDRNKHDLVEDFKSEIPCYVLANKIIDILDSMSLSDNPSDNLIKIYTKLVDNEITKPKELISLKGWLKDIDSLS